TQKSNAAEHTLKILVVHGAEGEDPVDVSVLVEAQEILPACGDTAKVFQKILLGPNSMNFILHFFLSFYFVSIKFVVTK
uniref:Uncharacterized protein n=1 Tax=Hippocampus comes TaxID=109280 RepID=A0A3Q3DWE5_HIPCM